jgi:hypothetical protein
MMARENSHKRLGSSEFRFNGQSFKKKCCIVDPKMIFSKNQERVILPLKCKHAPFPAESAEAYTKFRIYLKRFCASKQELICASHEVYYLYGVLCLAFD